MWWPTHPWKDDRAAIRNGADGFKRVTSSYVHHGITAHVFLALLQEVKDDRKLHKRVHPTEALRSPPHIGTPSCPQRKVLCQGCS